MVADKALWNVVILGSGPAGLTAALYASRANLEPLVFGGSQPGGQLTITTEVENYPGFPNGLLGPEMMELFHKQAERFGTGFHSGDAVRIDLSTRPFTIELRDRTLRAATLIVATGASAKLLGIESEKRLMGYGVSACATCDGFFFKDKEVLSSAAATPRWRRRVFSPSSPVKVTVVHRRDTLRASKIMQDRARRNPKIEFAWNASLAEILGDPQQGGVTGVTLVDVRDGAKRERACDGVFIAIGHEPNTQLFRGQLDMDERGYILTRGKTTRDQRGRRLRLRRRAGPDLPASRHRRRDRLHGGDRRGAVPRGRGPLAARAT